MSHPVPTIVPVYKAFTADASAQEMKRYDISGHDPNGQSVGGPALDAGGLVNLGTATTAIVTIKDAVGATIYTATIAADTVIPPTAVGCYGPLNCTVASSNGTLTVWWYLKK